MTCDEIVNAIDPFVDGELEPTVAGYFAAHVAGCPECAERLSAVRALSRAVHEELPALAAPDDLRARVVAAIREPAIREPATRPSATRGYRSAWRPQWLAAAGLVVAAVGAGWLAGVAHGRPAAFDVRDAGVRDAIVASHLRSLQASHLVDVASSDRHTVKPWFNGRVDFSPTVVDLAAQGFPLIGGRLDYIDGHPAAALVYGRARHMINVFIWPSAPGGPTDVRPSAVRGYNVRHWTHDGMTYWAVSDVAGADLDTLVSLLQTPAQPSESTPPS
jgi:anti-sigma factor (TIGR02949 family)